MKEELLRYENPRIVARFMKDFGVSREVAEEYFLEIKKWLWLAQQLSEDIKERRTSPFPPPVTALPMLWDQDLLDGMWHTFILFTREYTDFCKTHFGRFLHHGPEVEVPWLESDEAAREEARMTNEKLRWLFRYVASKLGVETVVKWYTPRPPTAQQDTAASGGA